MPHPFPEKGALCGHPRREPGKGTLTRLSEGVTAPRKASGKQKQLWFVFRGALQKMTNNILSSPSVLQEPSLQAASL